MRVLDELVAYRYELNHDSHPCAIEAHFPAIPQMQYISLTFEKLLFSCSGVTWSQVVTIRTFSSSYIPSFNTSFTHALFIANHYEDPRRSLGPTLQPPSPDEGPYQHPVPDFPSTVHAEGNTEEWQSYEIAKLLRHRDRRCGGEKTVREHLD